MADKKDCVFLIEGVLNSNRWEGKPNKHRVNHKQINYHQDAIDAIYFVMRRFTISQSNALMLLKDFFEHIHLDCPLPSQSALSRRKPSAKVSIFNKGKYFVISGSGIKVLKTKPKSAINTKHELIGYQSKGHISFRIGDNRYRFSHKVTRASKKIDSTKNEELSSIQQWLRSNRQQVGLVKELLDIDSDKLFDALIPFYPVDTGNRKSLEDNYSDFMKHKSKDEDIKKSFASYQITKHKKSSIEVVLVPYKYTATGKKETIRQALFIRCLHSNLSFIRYLPDVINNYPQPLEYSISALKKDDIVLFTLTLKKNQYYYQNFVTFIVCSTQKAIKPTKKAFKLGKNRTVNKSLFAESITNNEKVSFVEKQVLHNQPVTLNIGNIQTDSHDTVESFLSEWIYYLNQHNAEPLMEDIETFETCKKNEGFVGEFHITSS